MKSAKAQLCAKLQLEKYPINRKPVEKQGRKAMGLPLSKHNQDRQAAEDHILVFSSAGLVKHQARFIFF